MIFHELLFRLMRLVYTPFQIEARYLLVAMLVFLSDLLNVASSSLGTLSLNAVYAISSNFLYLVVFVPKQEPGQSDKVVLVSYLKYFGKKVTIIELQRMKSE